MNRLRKGIGVVGSTTIDKIIIGDHSYLKLGGVTTYAGITYRRHGIPVFVVSNMADQDLRLSCLKTEQTLDQIMDKARAKEDATAMNKVMGASANKSEETVQKIARSKKGQKYNPTAQKYQAPQRMPTQKHSTYTKSNYNHKPYGSCFDHHKTSRAQLEKTRVCDLSTITPNR